MAVTDTWDKFYRTSARCGCPVCGRQRFFWRRPTHGPTWKFSCSPCRLEFYGNQPRDVARFIRLTRNWVKRQGIAPEVRRGDV